MDYDADGILDMVSGSYDPGDLYLFRGLGQGRYAKGTTLRDEAQVPLVHHPQELVKYEELDAAGKGNDDTAIRFRVASFGSWPAFVDWDADGDLDVLIGAFDGTLWRRENLGTRKEPRYAKESRRMDLGSEPLRVRCHACPVIADWDGDGRWDLLLGSGDGSVVLHRNEGEAKAPRFGAAIPLVSAKSSSKFATSFLAPGEAPPMGARAQIAVTDFDRDGKLDLLVGDHSYQRRFREGSAEELATAAALAGKQRALQERYREMEADDPSRAALKQELDAIKAELEKCLEPGEAKGASYVWLLRRR
ncbi:MAG: VCBS repeat-containing protein [Planctomycetes bacterium]|nr:VCBS repeat-containing protein [Planctomycetota bacterium]